MKIFKYLFAFLLLSTSAFSQGSRQIQSGDVTGALGYTPLRSIGAMLGPNITCGAGLSCSLNTMSVSGAGSSGQIQFNNSGVLGGFTMTGDATINTSTGALTLSTANPTPGSFGSASQCVSITTNGKGLITAASQTACVPASLNASQLTSGTIPAARTNGHQNGTATNDNAAAGEIGEFISSTVLAGSAVSLTSGAAANITSISLTAGDWDCSGLTVSNPNAATTQSGNYGWISSVSATVPTVPNNGGIGAALYAAPAGSGVFVAVPTHRISLASTTTTYLSTLSVFAVNTNSAYGWIGCRRAR